VNETGEVGVRGRAARCCRVHLAPPGSETRTTRASGSHAPMRPSSGSREMDQVGARDACGVTQIVGTPIEHV
jgi:hypothetical protein